MNWLDFIWIPPFLFGAVAFSLAANHHRRYITNRKDLQEHTAAGKWFNLALAAFGLAGLLAAVGLLT